MSSVNWQNFGLKKNPFDILPLLEGGDLPMEHAFVGRGAERDTIDRVIESDDRGCIIISGDVGVGKTTLANFTKFRRKHFLEQKRLFSSRRELEAGEATLNKQSFLFEMIGSILREIQLLNPELLKEVDLLKKMYAMIDLTQTIELSGGLSGGFAGFSLGLDGGKGKGISQPFQIPTTTLEGHFRDLVSFIKTHEISGSRHEGLIVHMNNFDIVMRDPEGLSYVRRFFQEVRDILQMPHVYFLFLGPRNFFKDVIAKEARVKAIFHQTPILLAPLTKTEIVDALNKRMEILKSDKVARYLRPFKDEVIFQLYDLYQGDLRSILGALKNIASELGDRATEPLGMEEAMFLLSRERWRHVEGALTPEQKLILEYIVKKGQPITQKEIVIHFKKTQANVAHYYFGPFKDHGIIEEIERRGTTKYWYLTKDYEVLKFLQTSKEKIAVQIEEKAHQSSFFE